MIFRHLRSAPYTELFCKQWNVFTGHFADLSSVDVSIAYSNTEVVPDAHISRKVQNAKNFATIWLFRMSRTTSGFIIVAASERFEPLLTRSVLPALPTFPPYIIFQQDRARSRSYLGVQQLSDEEIQKFWIGKAGLTAWSAHYFLRRYGKDKIHWPTGINSFKLTKTSFGIRRITADK